MLVTKQSLTAVDQHWAVLAVGEEIRDAALKGADALMVQQAVGQQIEFDFQDIAVDHLTLQKLLMAYELSALEGLNAYISQNPDQDDLRQQCAAGSWRAYDIIKLFKIPTETNAKIQHVLKVSALGYCGDRWSDIRRWYVENSDSINVPSVAGVGWESRVLFRLFECWIRLFRKKRWDDLDRIREIIVGLRQDQNEFEPGSFQNDSNVKDRAAALRLLALYNWAKATELVAKYMIQGEPAGIIALVDKHFEAAISAASATADAQLDVLLRWLHATSKQMISGSLWWVARRVNSRVTKFVGESTKRGMFELLPPQQAAIQEMGLLDTAATAIVVEMPTSGGKTLLAQFRMLQALNMFADDGGWVAYVSPTKALTAQISRRLKRDFEPIGVQVRHLSGAIEVDTYEDEMLRETEGNSKFDILVTTPEKLQFIVRNKKIQRPLTLVVMDEAHNIEDVSRGLRMELLLATIKRDFAEANFLLLMPFVEKTENLARWLADDANAGRDISLSSTPWKPNDRIVGMYDVVAAGDKPGDWQLEYTTLTTTPNSVHLGGTHKVGGIRPLIPPKSQMNATMQTAAMAKIMSQRGTSIAVARTIPDSWNMARKLKASMEPLRPVPDEIQLVQNFLRTEVSPDFELIGMLSRGIGLHHAGLSEEVRALVEWLAEEGKLSVLCATSTIAQGINFPVTSVFMASKSIPQKGFLSDMRTRDFWNFAGRAGRMDHDSVGVVGLAAGTDPDSIKSYVSEATGELVSRLVCMLDELEQAGKLNNLEGIMHSEQWDDFRCYVAHLWNEKKSLDAVLADTEQLLRNTFGYRTLRASQDGAHKADQLLNATKEYAKKLAKNPGYAELADTTGFSPEGVQKALIGMQGLERKLTVNDWTPESMFGEQSGMADLYGVMLKVPQISDSLDSLAGEGSLKKNIAEITKAWVGGETIKEIAEKYFTAKAGDDAVTISNACRAIYRDLVNSGTWGMAALSHMSGLDFDSLGEEQLRSINSIPAMIYHGVKSEEAILMRMNSVPRSIAENMGNEFCQTIERRELDANVDGALAFIKTLNTEDWERIRPQNAHLSGSEYQEVWKLLSGEQ